MKNSLRLSIVFVTVTFIYLFLINFGLTGCGNDSQDIGIGPVKKINLNETIDNALVEKGKTTFNVKCFTCHKWDSKVVGPPLQGITKRRKPEWIMNMILNPEQMTKENKEAKKLFEQYKTQMTFQNITEDETRSILEYFRSLDTK
jgi:cytochrome c